MLTEQNQRDRIIFALRCGPLHRSALADSWKLPMLVSVSFYTLFLVVAAFFPAANTTGQEDATMDLAMMEPAEPVLRTAPEIVYVGPPLTMEFKASTSTPAETLRSLVSGLPEDINTARTYLVRLTIQPSVKE
jgi:hypothetical protein